MHIPCYKPWNSGSKHICQYKPRLLSSSPARGPKLTQLVKNRTTTSGKELKPSSSSKVVKRSVVRRLSGEIEPLPRRWTFFDGHSWVARLIHLPTLKHIYIHYMGWKLLLLYQTGILGRLNVACRWVPVFSQEWSKGKWGGGQKFPQNVSCLRSSIICVPTQQ